ncbi:MAG TPA: DUF1499 domain-containing protein, partial [Rhodospirillales bacterium]|nr:DUF1499 domain-containing protein [Rhodospirillales bacterium]
AIFVIVTFMVLAHKSKSGAPPGLVDGRLAACPKRPNCIGSEDPKDRNHYIEPMPFPEGGMREAGTAVRQVIAAMGGQVNVDQPRYLAATFRTPVFGFVDDLEFRFDDENQTINLRSASRSGYSDRGVNRKRIRRLRKMF